MTRSSRPITYLLIAGLLVAGLAGVAWWRWGPGPRRQAEVCPPQLEPGSCLRINYLYPQQVAQSGETVEFELVLEQHVCGLESGCPSVEQSLPRMIDARAVYDPARLTFLDAQAGPAAITAAKEAKVGQRVVDGEGIVRTLLLSVNNTNRISPGIVARYRFQHAAHVPASSTPAAPPSLFRLDPARTHLAPPPKGAIQLKLGDLR